MDLYYKHFTIVNDDHKALSDATIWSINLTASFMIATVVNYNG